MLELWNIPFLAMSFHLFQLSNTDTFQWGTSEYLSDQQSAEDFNQSVEEDVFFLLKCIEIS